MIIFSLNDDLTEFKVFDQDGNEVKDHGLEAIQLAAQDDSGKVIAGILIGRDVTHDEMEGLRDPKTIGPSTVDDE